MDHGHTVSALMRKYSELSGKLAACRAEQARSGMPESQGSVTMKINRVAFPTWFFMASMKAIGKPHVTLDETWRDETGRGS